MTRLSVTNAYNHNEPITLRLTNVWYDNKKKYYKSFENKWVKI
jgi:hypothetical protein